MRRKFNVLGNCTPDKHYMVDIREKMAHIQAMVDAGLYFTINRARQYGKTTTLGLLKKKLDTSYTVLSMSFQDAADEAFETTDALIKMLLRRMGDMDPAWNKAVVEDFDDFSNLISTVCKEKKVVLIIDEVDKAAGYRGFLKFLDLLRQKYLDRNDHRDTTFHSVILAGVYDIKNIKRKMTVSGQYMPYENEGPMLSPWNIAAAFKVDMAFSPAEIATMLRQYEADHHTGMDIKTVSQDIYHYTGGYPFLVSRLCQCIDEEINKHWSATGVQAAVKIIINEDNTLFDDIHKNMANHPMLYDLLYDIVITARPRTFARGSLPISIGLLYGIIKEENEGVAVANKIFESVICRTFIADDEMKNPDRQITGVLKEDVIQEGKFNMALCLKKFAQHYNASFTDRDLAFYERHGRLLFLTYLQPLINGRGFYHFESETRNARRMDIVVDYNNEQFIVELKLWSGDVMHDKAYTQLLGYMDSKGAAEVYLLTFDFRQNEHKERKAEWVEIKGKRIFDVVV